MPVRHQLETRQNIQKPLAARMQRSRRLLFFLPRKSSLLAMLRPHHRLPSTLPYAQVHAGQDRLIMDKTFELVLCFNRIEREDAVTHWQPWEVWIFNGIKERALSQQRSSAVNSGSFFVADHSFIPFPGTYPNYTLFEQIEAC
jgi:hypothetical protein